MGWEVSDHYPTEGEDPLNKLGGLHSDIFYRDELTGKIVPGMDKGKISGQHWASGYLDPLSDPTNPSSYVPER